LIQQVYTKGSRPLHAFKPWASLKIIGSKGYSLLFRHARNSTDYFKEILDSCGNFETLNNPELFILNYRFIPEQVQNQIIIWKKGRTQSGKQEKKTEIRIQKTNRLINSLNIKLHRALRKDDTTFVSRTTLESTIYRPQNIVVLRAVLINPLTEKETLDEIKDTQNRIGLEMWKEFKPAFERIRLIND
jgi:glutamate decarboxylase